VSSSDQQDATTILDQAIGPNGGLDITYATVQTDGYHPGCLNADSFEIGPSHTTSSLVIGGRYNSALQVQFSQLTVGTETFSGSTSGQYYMACDQRASPITVNG
jgi:hypothetical protein